MLTTNRSAWINDLVTGLEGLGPEAAQALRYLEQHKTRVSVHDQPTGGRWTADRRIEIHPRYAEMRPDDPRVVALIIHEVRHLQQGPLTALSVYGELEAWQLQFRFLRAVMGKYHPDPQHEAVIGQLMSLPLGWDREVLTQVRGLMQQYAGNAYRIDLLPRYPLHREIAFRLTGVAPRGAIHPED